MENESEMDCKITILGQKIKGANIKQSIFQSQSSLERTYY